MMSSRMTSGFSRAATSSPALPFSAVKTPYPEAEARSRTSLMAIGSSSITSRFFTFLSFFYRQRKIKAAAFVGSFALYPDIPSVRFHDALAYSQTQPRSGRFRDQSALDLVELGE